MKTKKKTTGISLNKKTIQKLSVFQQAKVLGGKGGNNTGDTSRPR